MKWIFVLTLGLSPLVSLSCDLCGCSANGNYLNVVPGGQKTYFGLGHYYRTFTSTHPVLFVGETPTSSSEVFRTTELFGRIQLHPKLQLFGFLPVHQNTITEHDGSYTNSGIGDIRFSLVTPLIRSNWEETPEWRFLVLSGIGVKLPTGKFNFKPEDMELLLPNLQLGSGSWDGLVFMNFSARKKQWITNLDASISYNGTNSNGYQFGTRTSSRIQSGFWLPSFKLKGAIVPQIGMQLDHASTDYNKTRPNTFSGGHQLYSFCSLQVYSGKWMLGARYFYAVDQDFAGGHVVNNFKGELSVTYFPSSNKKSN